MRSILEIVSLGDRALIVRLGQSMQPETFREVHALIRQLDAHPPKAAIEWVPAIGSVTVFYDPIQATFAEMRAALEAAVGATEPLDASETPLVEIPVCYGGEHGEDLETVAEQCGLSADEVITLHSQAEYVVYMLGFVPGFPYLGGMSRRLAAPRKAIPRIRIPAGSVGIAGEQTGIYPFATPGGWQLIGRTPLSLFDAERIPPARLRPGERVRFVRITPDEFRELRERT